MWELNNPSIIASLSLWFLSASVGSIDSIHSRIFLHQCLISENYPRIFIDSHCTHGHLEATKFKMSNIIYVCIYIYKLLERRTLTVWRCTTCVWTEISRAELQVEKSYVFIGIRIFNHSLLGRKCCVCVWFDSITWTLEILPYIWRSTTCVWTDHFRGNRDIVHCTMYMYIRSIYSLYRNLKFRYFASRMNTFRVCSVLEMRIQVVNISRLF